MDEALMVGKYAAPFILTTILAVIYSRSPILTDKMKNDIALFVGIVLGELALFLQWDAGNFQISATSVILNALEGFLMGCTAVGLWKTFNIQSGKSGTSVISPTLNGGTK